MEGWLDTEAIEAIVSALRPYPYGWRHELPASYRFFGQPISVTIETQSFPTTDLAPRPTPAEVYLARQILAGFSGVLATAAREYVAYNVDVPGLLEKVHEPRIWICREFQATDGPGRWALTSGIVNAPDWTIFIEFCELTFLEIWSGD
jgi:hypothetical protein